MFSRSNGVISLPFFVGLTAAAGELYPPVCATSNPHSHDVCTHECLSTKARTTEQKDRINRAMSEEETWKFAILIPVVPFCHGTYLAVGGHTSYVHIIFRYTQCLVSFWVFFFLLISPTANSARKCIELFLVWYKILNQCERLTVYNITLICSMNF